MEADSGTVHTNPASLALQFWSELWELTKKEARHYANGFKVSFWFFFFLAAPNCGHLVRNLSHAPFHYM